MAIHWQIPFMSLRTSTLYTVNIYDATYSGSPVVLKGGGQPFTTQEDDDEDMFTLIRTQSGYLRIVDDGFAADGTTVFNWKSLLPSTDTDRPVTLTNGGGTVVWQGFMQAQNFGGTLFGNPQEREFPVQCALTTLSGTDINYQQTTIQNFAYLLNYILSSIPTISIDNIYIQGGADAQAWLLKKIDWQNFVSEDGDGNLSARYNLYQCLEDMCRFWGWTARTHRKNLYLTMADASGQTTWLSLTRAQLTTMAGGTAAGTTNGTFTTRALSGDIFASTNNIDYRDRGPNKATVQADAGEGNSDLDFAPASLVKTMHDLNYNASTVTGDNDMVAGYTNDLLTFSLPFMNGTARSTYGSFNLVNIYNLYQGSSEGNEFPVIKIKKSYTNASADAYASMETIYHHCFSDGTITLNGCIYRGTEKYVDTGQHDDSNIRYLVGLKTMYIRLGIGTDRAHASWWNGSSWQAQQTACAVTIGNADNLFRCKVTHTQSTFYGSRIKVSSSLTGRIFLDFLGSDDLDNIDGQKSFEIADFSLTFSRNNTYRNISSGDGGHSGGNRDPSNVVERANYREYISTNGNDVRMEYNNDCIYASDNAMEFGYGVLINPDGTYFKGYNYGGQGLLVFPEQWLANRVTSYWATAKRRIKADLRSDIANVSATDPMTKNTIDSTTMYPISISHEWRDDITNITMIEL